MSATSEVIVTRRYRPHYSGFLTPTVLVTVRDLSSGSMPKLMPIRSQERAVDIATHHLDW